MTLYKMQKMNNTNLNYLNLFLLWYAISLLALFIIYNLSFFINDFLIFNGHVDLSKIVLFLKETHENTFSFTGYNTPTKVINYPLMDINKAQTMSLQEKIAYTLVLLDINLLFGIDLKGFSEGIYGIVHVGVEASTLTHNAAFNTINPYAVVLNIPFSFLQTTADNIPNLQEIVNQWTATMQPCQIKTLLNISNNNVYGLPQISSFSTKFNVYSTDTFSFSFGVQIPFEHIANPKKYGVGVSFNIF